MRRLNGWLTVFWIVMIPISAAMHWLSSVTHVSALSIWALVSGHWSTWQAVIEVAQQEEIRTAKAGPRRSAPSTICGRRKSAAPSN
jgi:hypothetical protein